MFKAIIVNKAEDETISAHISDVDESQLPADGNVTIEVHYSDVNFKDGLCLNGKGRLVREYPHIPGIDFSGIVLESDDPRFSPGDKVINTGWRVGEVWFGGSIDRIWRVAGDDSTDFSFYTKRGLLGAVYSATLLYFLADNSGSMDNSSAFLDRRLKEISVIPKLSKPLKKQSEFVATAIGKTFSSIAKNISQKMAKRGY
ncbi:COQ9 family protein [Alphaproteobacteria bacterium]|nr:COQ9 family protein [Alphaproteobacteria bacterium]